MTIGRNKEIVATMRNDDRDHAPQPVDPKLTGKENSPRQCRMTKDRSRLRPGPIGPPATSLLPRSKIMIAPCRASTGACSLDGSVGLKSVSADCCSRSRRPLKSACRSPVTLGAELNHLNGRFRSSWTSDGSFFALFCRHRIAGRRRPGVRQRRFPEVPCSG